MTAKKRVISKSIARRMKIMKEAKDREAIEKIVHNITLSNSIDCICEQVATDEEIRGFFDDRTIRVFDTKRAEYTDAKITGASANGLTNALRKEFLIIRRGK